MKIWALDLIQKPKIFSICSWTPHKIFFCPCRGKIFLMFLLCLKKICLKFHFFGEKKKQNFFIFSWNFPGFFWEKKSKFFSLLCPQLIPNSGIIPSSPGSSGEGGRRNFIFYRRGGVLWEQLFWNSGFDNPNLWGFFIQAREGQEIWGGIWCQENIAWSILNVNNINNSMFI